MIKERVNRFLAHSRNEDSQVRKGHHGLATMLMMEAGAYKGFHGGTVADDNSGSLKYVRIEYAGIPLNPNQEINSLTMGSVGSGTTLEYIMASFGLDDSFEWFGGTVNAKYLIAYNKITKDRYLPTGPELSQSAQLYDISGDKMQLILDFPTIGEPHYAQMIQADLITKNQPKVIH